MKPIIAESQYQILKQLIAFPPTEAGYKELGQLTAELNRAEVIADDQLTEDIIAINSVFEIEELNAHKKMKLTLVLPEMADLKQKKISVLSPLGVAVIGYKKGDIVDWILPAGAKRLKILEVSAYNS